MKNLPKYLIFLIFTSLILIFLILLYKLFVAKPDNNSDRNCLYETRILEGQEIPIRVDGDVQFIDNKTLIVTNPRGCKKKFEFKAKAGSPGDPITRIYSLERFLTDEQKQDIREAGVESSPAFYIGDRALLDAGQSEISIKDRGALADLYESDKKFSTKNAYVIFNWFDYIYYDRDQVYLNQIFFSEK